MRPMGQSSRSALRNWLALGGYRTVQVSPSVDHRLKGVVVVAQAGCQRNLVTGQVVVRRRIDIAEDANGCPVEIRRSRSPWHSQATSSARSIVEEASCCTTPPSSSPQGPGLRINDAKGDSKYQPQS